MKPRHAARAPFFAINIQAVKQECATQMIGKSLADLKQLLVYRKKNRGSVTAIATRLGDPGSVTPQWLILTDKNSLPKPEKVAFPKPPKAPDGSLVYERVPNKPEAEKIPLNNMSPSLKRRAYDEMNGIDSKWYLCVCIDIFCIVGVSNFKIFFVCFYWLLFRSGLG